MPSPPAGRAARLRGLFVGGTLCDEAMLVAPRPRPDRLQHPAADWALGATCSDGHTMVDLGDDRFTVGRPHPMIDGSDCGWSGSHAEVDDPTTGVLLLDVVLGLGAADDPAGELAGAVRAATVGRRPGGRHRRRHPRRPAGPARAGGGARRRGRLGVPVQRGRGPRAPSPCSTPEVRR